MINFILAGATASRIPSVFSEYFGGISYVYLKEESEGIDILRNMTCKPESTLELFCTFLFLLSVKTEAEAAITTSLIQARQTYQIKVVPSCTEACRSRTCVDQNCSLMCFLLTEHLLKFWFPPIFGESGHLII